jgi:hypothetical protein
MGYLLAWYGLEVDMEALNWPIESGSCLIISACSRLLTCPVKLFKAYHFTNCSGVRPDLSGVCVTFRGVHEQHMAVVRHLEEKQLDVEASHTETECTYSIIHTKDGARFLQVDTYGSSDRKIAGKKSQSIRFAPEAIRELVAIVKAHFPDSLP